MGFLGGLFKAVVDVATLPVSVVKDVIEAGEGESTENTIEKLKEDLEEAGNGLTGFDDFI